MRHAAAAGLLLLFTVGGAEAMDLEPATERVGLPMAAIAPLAAAALGERVYVAGLDPAGEATHVVAVDGAGHTTPIASLPLAVSAMAACGGELVLVGERIADGVPLALAIATDGAVRRRVELAGARGGARRPLVACVDGHAWAAWVSGDARPALCVASLAPGSTGHEAARQPLADSTHALAIAGAGGRLVALRAHGIALNLELLAFSDGRAAGRAELPEVQAVQDVSLHGDGARLLAAWRTSAGEVAWQTLDATLATVGTRGHFAAGPATRGMALITDGTRRALRVRRATGAHVQAGLRGQQRGEPVEVQDEQVLLLDGASAPRRLVPPGTQLAAGAWLGERLLLFHGDDQLPYASIFRAAAVR